MQVLDLFSGIGGFSLGLERAGMKTVAFCEVDAKARAVLKKHWPDVPIFEDVKTLRGADINERIDVICGGFPCQDISFAGAGAGLAGERSGLWFEFHRLIEEIRPRFAIIENVAALRSGGLDEVLRGLAEIGYDAEWNCIPAAALGAPHERDRMWIVAYPALLGRGARGSGRFTDRLSWLSNAPRWDTANPDRQPQERASISWQERFAWPDEPALCGMDDGVSGRMDRIKQLGNAVVPQIPQLIGEAIMFEEMCK